MTPQGTLKDTGGPRTVRPRHRRSSRAANRRARTIPAAWEHVFVSEIREAVARLLAQELSLNEIAHRLDVARSTVGYHAAALREQRQDGQRKGRRAINGGPPVAARDVTRERV